MYFCGFGSLMFFCLLFREYIFYGEDASKAIIVGILLGMNFTTLHFIYFFLHGN